MCIFFSTLTQNGLEFHMLQLPKQKEKEKEQRKSTENSAIAPSDYVRIYT